MEREYQFRQIKRDISQPFCITDRRQKLADIIFHTIFFSEIANLGQLNSEKYLTIHYI